MSTTPTGVTWLYAISLRFFLIWTTGRHWNVRRQIREYFCMSTHTSGDVWCSGALWRASKMSWFRTTAVEFITCIYLIFHDILLRATGYPVPIAYNVSLNPADRSQDIVIHKDVLNNNTSTQGIFISITKWYTHNCIYHIYETSVALGIKYK